jgi:hypothetical protein
MNRTTGHATLFAGSRVVGAFFYAAIAGYLLFAHGCHGGDEDHELSLLPCWLQREADEACDLEAE